jgi:uncharacterized protein (UPF0332 family)
MTLKYSEEIAANIARAEESIRAAKELVSNGYYDFAASRAYYAAFYAATAVLLADELEYGKHSGVIAAIHQRLVRTGRLDKKFGRDLNWLFELRSVGDYGVTIHVPQEDAEKAVDAAERFLRATKQIIEKD